MLKLYRLMMLPMLCAPMPDAAPSGGSGSPSATTQPSAADLQSKSTDAASKAQNASMIAQAASKAADQYDNASKIYGLAGVLHTENPDDQGFVTQAISRADSDKSSADTLMAGINPPQPSGAVPQPIANSGTLPNAGGVAASLGLPGVAVRDRPV